MRQEIVLMMIILEKETHILNNIKSKFKHILMRILKHERKGHRWL